MNRRTWMRWSKLGAPGVVGGALLLVWLTAMSAALVMLLPRLHANGDDAPRIERYLAALATPTRNGALVAYRVTDCTCRAVAGNDAALRRRFQDAGFTFRELPASALPLPYPLVVTGRDARLLYAGPTQLDALCANRDHDPLVRLVASLANSPQPSMILASECHCS